MSCECHQIGGRFIAEDPDCEVHGTAAQERDRIREATTFDSWWSSMSYEDRLAFSRLPVQEQLHRVFEAAKDMS